MKKCLIYIDKYNYKNSIDLLEVGRQIYKDIKFESYAVSINDNFLEFMGIFENIIQVDDKNILENDSMAATNIMEEINNKYKFDCILIPATQFGRMLAPRLAMRLKVGLVADVTSIHNDKGIIEMIRPAFSGKIMAAVGKVGEGPIMMSVRENVFSYVREDSKNTKIIRHIPRTTGASKLNLIDSKSNALSYDIQDSQVLVSGGGGTSKNFKKLDKLAKELNAQVSASRKIIDKGIAPRAIQVGQSGKTVSPKLYIAIGINGSIQHIAGLKDVEHIISVNKNKNAPISSISDIVIEGDSFEFIDKLVEKIRLEKNNNISE